jgi:uncharacterized protein (DUF1684 family)
MPQSTFLDLLDWRRRTSELFADLRQRSPDATTLDWFRQQKDALFRTHPQSPIAPADRPTFAGLRYWEFNPQARVTARFAPVETELPPIDQKVEFFRIGTLRFDLFGQETSLAAFWINGYAGGLFVPFRDATCGHETYGAGRYLLDTIKSADHGSDYGSNTVVLDFNYAYHPSCAYDPQWVCPLAPPDSRLTIPVRVGERLS